MGKVRKCHKETTKPVKRRNRERIGFPTVEKYNRAPAVETMI